MSELTNKVESNITNSTLNYVPTVGKNIHSSPVDGKLLCSYSDKICMQRRLNGYAFCIRHILQDKNAPFKRCQYVARYNGIQCTNAVPISENRLYCNSHMQVLGLVPKRLKMNNSSTSLEQENRVKGSDSLENSPAINTHKITEFTKSNKKVEDITTISQSNKKKPISGLVKESNNISLFEKCQDFWSWYRSFDKTYIWGDIHQDWSFLSSKWIIQLPMPHIELPDKTIDFKEVENEMVSKLKAQLLQLEISNRSLQESLARASQSALHVLSSLSKNDGQCTLHRSSHKRTCRASRDNVPCYLAPFPCCGYCQNHMKNDKEQVLFSACTTKTNRGTTCSQILFNCKSDKPVCYRHINERVGSDYVNTNEQQDVLNKDKKRRLTGSSYTAVCKVPSQTSDSSGYVKIHQIPQNYKQINIQHTYQNDAILKKVHDSKSYQSSPYNNIVTSDNPMIYQQNINVADHNSNVNTINSNHLSIKTNNGNISKSVDRSSECLQSDKALPTNYSIKTDSNSVKVIKNENYSIDMVDSNESVGNRQFNSQEIFKSVGPFDNNFVNNDPANYYGYFQQFDMKSFKSNSNWNNQISNAQMSNNHNNQIDNSKDPFPVSLPVNSQNIEYNDTHKKTNLQIQNKNYIDPRMVGSVPVQNIIMIPSNNSKLNGITLDTSAFNSTDVVINKLNVNYSNPARNSFSSNNEFNTTHHVQSNLSFNINHNNNNMPQNNCQNKAWPNQVWSNEPGSFQSNVPIQYISNNSQNSQKYLVHNMDIVHNVVDDVTKLNDGSLSSANCNSPFNHKENNFDNRSSSSDFFLSNNVFQHQTNPTSQIHYQQSMSPVNLYQIINNKSSYQSNPNSNQITQSTVSLETPIQNDSGRLPSTTSNQSFQI